MRKSTLAGLAALCCLGLSACGSSETEPTEDATEEAEAESAAEQMTERDETVVRLMGLMVGQPMDEFLPMFGAQFVRNVLAANGVVPSQNMDQLAAMVDEHFAPYRDATMLAFGQRGGADVTDEQLQVLSNMAGDQTGQRAITCSNMRSNGQEPAFAPCEAELGISFDPDGRAALTALFEGTKSVLGDEESTAGIALAMCQTANDVVQEQGGRAMAFEDLEIQFAFGDRLGCGEWQRIAERQFGE